MENNSEKVFLVVLAVYAVLAILSGRASTQGQDQSWNIGILEYWVRLCKKKEPIFHELCQKCK